MMNNPEHHGLDRDQNHHLARAPDHARSLVQKHVRFLDPDLDLNRAHALGRCDQDHDHVHGQDRGHRPGRDLHPSHHPDRSRGRDLPHGRDPGQSHHLARGHHLDHDRDLSRNRHDCGPVMFTFLKNLLAYNLKSNKVVNFYLFFYKFFRKPGIMLKKPLGTIKYVLCIVYCM